MQAVRQELRVHGGARRRVIQVARLEVVLDPPGQCGRHTLGDVHLLRGARYFASEEPVYVMVRHAFSLEDPVQVGVPRPSARAP